MKIARPSKPEAPFKRKRSPPPQATKLLRSSLLAGVVFMVLLAIVFLPRMFPNQPPREIVNPAKNGLLRLDTTNGTRLYVDEVTVSLDLGKFQANLSLNGTVIASLAPDLSGGSSALRFVDSNGNRLLDPGDHFDIACIPSGTYRFELLQVDVNALAGWSEWTGCTAT